MKTKLAQQQRELTAALQTVRVLLKEIGGNYLAVLQSDLARVARVVAAAQETDTPDHQRLADAQRMLRAIGKLDVKPEKGRRRDVKELDELIKHLNEITEEW